MAFEIDTGNPDLTIRWDNAVRFNYAVRIEERDSKIGNSPIADEGTWSFDRGDAVATRLDLLTEVDLIWKKNFGARRRSQGTVPAAQSALGLVAGHRHAVAVGAVPVRVGVVPLSRGWHLPRPGRLRLQWPRPSAFGMNQ
jgi:hypothetical protein